MSLRKELGCWNDQSAHDLLHLLWRAPDSQGDDLVVLESLSVPEHSIHHGLQFQAGGAQLQV